MSAELTMHARGTAGTAIRLFVDAIYRAEGDGRLDGLGYDDKDRRER